MTKVTELLTHEQLQAYLRAHAQETGVTVLHAAESGSRGWGFASPDSDYDGRYIYVWPQERYLSPFPSPDTTRMMSGDLDFEGWELGKVLRSLRKGNPVVLEWVQSPVVYHDSDGFGKALLEAFGSPDDFNAPAAVGHYLGMSCKSFAAATAHASGPWQCYRPKKMFYALRGVLAALYTMEKGSMPPMAWSELLSACTDMGEVSPGVLDAMSRLMVEKTSHRELHEVPELSVWDLVLFIRESTHRMQAYMDRSRKHAVPPEGKYAEFFRWAVGKWGTTT